MFGISSSGEGSGKLPLKVAQEANDLERIFTGQILVSGLVASPAATSCKFNEYLCA